MRLDVTVSLAVSAFTVRLLLCFQVSNFNIWGEMFELNDKSQHGEPNYKDKMCRLGFFPYFLFP